MNFASDQIKNGSPSVSILMAVYNGAGWLNDAIQSVLNQTFKDFEFIIVDDGSSDGSLKIIQRYQQLDSRISVISKVNTGLADSLNCGIKTARGSWVARLDADDICEPTRLEKQFERVRNESEIVFVGTGLVVIDKKGRKSKTYTYPTTHIQLLNALKNAKKFPAHSSAFYRTNAVREIGGYRPRVKLAEDWDLWLRLSEVGKLTCLREQLIQLRWHDNQISNFGAGRQQLFDARMAIVSYWIRCAGEIDPLDDDETQFNFFKNWLKKKLLEDHFFEFHDYSNLIISKFSREPFSLINKLKLINQLLMHPIFLTRFLKTRILGDHLTRRLALKWVSEKKNRPTE